MAFGAERFESLSRGVRAAQEEGLVIGGISGLADRGLPCERPDSGDEGAMGGMAGEADDVLAVAQAEIRRNLLSPDPAGDMDPDRMDATMYSREVASQAEFDGGRGNTAGIRF